MHFRGNKHGSVFRLHVGTALLDRDHAPREQFIEWFGNHSSMPEVERLVTEYMVQRFFIRCLEVRNRPLREAWERRLIYTLAQCLGCVPSEQWLGRWAIYPEIRGVGLWNVEHTMKGELLNGEDIYRFRHLLGGHDG